MGNVEPGELVGRAKEVAELERLVGRVAGGQGQAVVVRGEPGIGKTRLVKTRSKPANASGSRPTWQRHQRWRCGARSA